jgi:putative FmdB family regulatory protein
MPTYHYICKNCTHEFEEFQRISDNQLEVCPSCGEKSLKRIIGSGAGLIFKGSGFYLTDYKKSNSSPATSNSLKVENKSKTDIKPETSSSPKKSENNKSAE